VISPFDRSVDSEARIAVYLASGVRLVWVVHPVQRTVTIYARGLAPEVLGEGDVLDDGDVLPDFRASVVEVFT